MEKDTIEGIKQGTLYGYDIVLMAPKEVADDIINEDTLGNYIDSLLEYERLKHQSE